LENRKFKSTATGLKPRSAQLHSARMAHAHGVASAHVHSACAAHGHAGRGGGRAPTAVRLPAGHGGEGDNSSELLVGGEGEKTGSAAVFFRRGGATVAGGGPAMGRREGEVSSMLHG
jgi:hypothetical protein